MLNERLQRVAGGGASLLVGTADAELRPTTCRAVAIRGNDDFSQLTVYIPMLTGHQTIANIATTRRLAVSCSDIPTHVTVQFKGSSRAVRVARQDEADTVTAYISQFAEVLELVGVPRHKTRSFTHWPCFAVDVDVQEIYDQTPGPRAGSPLE